jgi:glycosyltransferase involved in cell wall biosynthesis
MITKNKITNINNILCAPISVIIPVYNIADYITETIDSILNQSIKPREIIIINDGSTDNTVELISEKYKDISLLKIFSQKNQGAGEARNLGITMSTSDFIFFCDSDDIITPGLFEEFNQKLLENSKLDMFCFSSNIFFENGAQMPKVHHKTSDWFFDAKHILTDLLINRDYTAASWTYIIRRTIVTENNLRFNGRIHEDHQITASAYLISHISYRTIKIFYLQRFRSGSLTRLNNIEISSLVNWINSFKNVIIIFDKIDDSNFNDIGFIRSKYITWSLFSLVDMCTNNFNSLPGIVQQTFKEFKYNPTSSLKEKLLLSSPTTFFYLKKIYLRFKV